MPARFGLGIPTIMNLTGPHSPNGLGNSFWSGRPELQVLLRILKNMGLQTHISSPGWMKLVWNGTTSIAN